MSRLVSCPVFVLVLLGVSATASSGESIYDAEVVSVSVYPYPWNGGAYIVLKDSSAQYIVIHMRPKKTPVVEAPMSLAEINRLLPLFQPGRKISAAYLGKWWGPFAEYEVGSTTLFTFE